MDEEPESDVFNGTERPLSTSFPPSRRGKLESPADGLSAAGSSESQKMRETCVLLLPKYLSISSDFVLLVRPFLIRVAFWWLLSLSLYGCLSLFLLLRLRHCLTSIQPSRCDFLISSRRFLSLALALCNRHTQTRLFRLIIHGRVRANLNDSGRCASFTQHPDAPSSPSCSSFSRTKLWLVPPVTYPQLIDAITWLQLGIYIVHEALDSLRTSTALRDGSQVEEIGVTFEYVGRNIVVIYRR